MNRPKIFLWSALFFSLAVAVFISPFASSRPDGLEKVAETHGFSEKGETAAWRFPVFPDYEWKSARNPFVNAAVAGGSGTLLAGLAAWILGKLLSKRNRAR
ncbi:MAG TPA: PDGLE domain-containing protein [Candidatus Omnitrophota bacterium]|nr:PDGLE domain-containing protein [Candidatus Omnitrophota bacterium]